MAKKAKTARKRAASRKGKAKVANDVAPDSQPKRQFKIHPDLVEYLLLGPTDDRRVLQDSPLLGDVWAAYADDPGNIQDLLITPHKDATAAEVAHKISKTLPERKGARKAERAKVAYLQGVVGARMFFDEVLRVLVPLTQWWYQPKIRDMIQGAGTQGLLRDQARLVKLLETAADMHEADPHKAVRTSQSWNFTSLERYIALAGLIYWIGRQPRPAKLERIELKDACELFRPHIEEIVAGMFELYNTVQADAKAPQVQNPDELEDDAFDGSNGYIFQVSLNRTAETALDRSVPAVKADAARSLFKVNCSKIVWAVLDSGIDSTHDAFMTVDKKKTPDPKKPQYMSRVRKTFDFTNIRNIVSNDAQDVDEAQIADLVRATGLPDTKVRDHLKTIAKNAKDKLPINWGIVEKLITLKPKQKPPKPEKAEAGAQEESGPVTPEPAASEESEFEQPEPKKSEPENSRSLDEMSSSHGTHVAGIIGADQFGYGVRDQHICRRHVPGYSPLRFPRAGQDAARDGICDNRGAAIHPLRQRAA